MNTNNSAGQEAFISFMENYIYGSAFTREDRDEITQKIWNYFSPTTPAASEEEIENESYRLYPDKESGFENAANMRAAFANGVEFATRSASSTPDKKDINFSGQFQSWHEVHPNKFIGHLFDIAYLCRTKNPQRTAKDALHQIEREIEEYLSTFKASSTPAEGEDRKVYSEKALVMAMTLMADELRKNGFGPCSVAAHKASSFWDSLPESDRKKLSAIR